MAKVTVDKADVLKWIVDSGATAREAAMRFNVKESTVRSWEHRARKSATSAAPPRRRRPNEEIDVTTPLHVLPAPPPRVEEPDVRENLRAAIRMRAERLARPVSETMESTVDSARILKMLVDSFDLADEKAKPAAEIKAPDLTTPEGQEQLVAELRALPRHILARAMEAA